MRRSGTSLNGSEVGTICDVGTTRRPAFVDVPICQSRTEKSGPAAVWTGPKGSPADEVERGGGGVT
jgi:hypothetical protein